MADYYDSYGNYIETVVYPGTVGYPIDTEDMDADEIAALRPIKVNRYDDEDD